VNATTTLLQVSSIGDGVRKRVFQRLQTTAGKYHSLRLAQVAATLQAGGHFDKVIEAIDQMMAVLRQEEQDDITHRDRCQVSSGKNTNDMEDLTHSIGVSEKSLEKMGGEKKDLMQQISNLEAEINATKTDMAELLSLRNRASVDFVQALKDDQDAIALLAQAIASLTKFYETNKIPLSLLSKQSPEYTIDEDKAPETTWKDGNYGGRDSESGGIISILSLIKEDLENEIKTARSDDATAQSDYVDQRNAMQATVDKTKASKTATEVGLADLEGKIQDTESAKNQMNKDFQGQDELKTALYSDCSWVETHFGSRREKRKAEMAGLTDAKSYLAGVEAGDEV
jgi:chromosome segregation ATPase